MTAFVDAYAVLGVAPGCSQAQLKAAHRVLVKRHHPDLHPPAERAAATARLQQINLAFGLVRDPHARAAYDRARAAWLVRERARSAMAPLGADARLAAELDRCMVAAGRWVARWESRQATLGRRAQARARAMAAGARTAGQEAGGRGRRAGMDVAGRVAWLVLSAGGTVVGFLLASTAGRLAGADGPAPALVGALGGMWLGSVRGWQTRLRLARGSSPSQRFGAWPLRTALLGWVALVAVAVLCTR